MPNLLHSIGSTHALHIWLGIPIMIRIFCDEYDPSGRVFHSPQFRCICCGIIVATILVTYFRNPARRLVMDEEDDEILELKKPSVVKRLAGSLSSTISSSSSSMFRNALFISVMFWFSWPVKNTMHYVQGAVDDICDADDMNCRIANHYGPPICCISPAFCDAKAHNWIYHQGGTAQAYKPDAPLSQTVCDPTEFREKKMRHKVATWPYSRSSRKFPPEIKLKLNLMRCSDGSKPKNKKSDNPHIEAKESENQGEEQQQQEGTVVEEERSLEEDDSSCCCYPLISGASLKNVTVEIWQTRPDGTYSSLRQGKDEGECRAKWIAHVDPNDHVFDSTSNPFTVDFTTMAPGSTGSLGGLGPKKWEFSPYGPPVLHIMVRPGLDGVAPLLVDVPVPIHPKTLEQRPFKWKDWRGPAWVKAKGHPEQPGFNITSWEPDLESRSVSIGVDLFLQEDKEYALSYTSSTSKLMCPSLVYGLPNSFFLEPISVCGGYFMDIFDL